LLEDGMSDERLINENGMALAVAKVVEPVIEGLTSLDDEARACIFEHNARKLFTRLDV